VLLPRTQQLIQLCLPAVKFLAQFLVALHGVIADLFVCVISHLIPMRNVCLQSRLAIAIPGVIRCDARLSLLGPQRFNGRNQARAKGRHERCDQSRQSERQDRCQRHYGIVWVHAVKLIAKESPYGERQWQPNE
jgi:hypothetical protein